MARPERTGVAEVENNVRVLCLNPYLPPPLGGIEKEMLAVASELARLGHELTLLATTARFPTGSGPEPVEIPAGIEVVRRRGYLRSTLRGFAPARAPIVVPGMARAAAEVRPDLVLAWNVGWGPVMRPVIASLRRLRSPPPILYRTYFHPPGGRLAAAKAGYILDTVARADRAIVPTQVEAETLLATGRLRRDQVVIVPPGVHRLAPSTEMIEAARRRYRLDGKLVIAHAARLGAFKGTEDLVAVLDEIRRRSGRDVVLLLIGADQSGGRIGAAIGRGLAEHVRLTGEVSDDQELRALLAASDLYAMPSEYEAFGIAYIEAAAAGLACLGCDVGGVGEAVGEGGVLLARFGDRAALADALVDLVADDPRRLRLGAIGRQRVLASLTWDRVAARLLEVAGEVRAATAGEARVTPELSVVIVNYRSAAEVAVAVEHLRRADPGLRLEIWVVDNASGPDQVAALGRLGEVRLLANPGNVGYGPACNQAAAQATGDHVLFLNPDVRARPGALRRLLAASAEHPEARVLAPQLLNLDGTLQHSARTFYTWWTVLLRRTPLGRILPDAAEVRRHLYADWDHGGEREVDWVLGACLLVRRAEFLGMGGFDPRFFLYFEDVDLCLRAWQSGGRVRYIGDATFVHAHRRESGGPGFGRARRLHLESMLRFLAKHGGWPQRALRGRRSLVFVNQGSGSVGERAERFAQALDARLIAKDASGSGRALRIAASVAQVLLSRPRHVHVIDVGFASLAVEAAARLAGARVVLDTGDEYFELLRRTDERRGLALALAGGIERLSLDLADGIAARGRDHVAALGARGYNGVSWLPDGVDTDRYRDAVADPSWRSHLGWNADLLVVGIVGSLLIDRRYGVTQGSELIEALPHAPAARAAIVGDGPGRGLLERRAREIGVSARVAFLGRVARERLPSILRTFDMCLSTQTNDAVGRARTTGKLPLYMAAGRFVLATDVGEARRVLPASMRLAYHGEYDPGYAARLGRRLSELAADRSQLAAGVALAGVAQDLFDYRQLAEQVVRLRTEVAP